MDPKEKLFSGFPPVETSEWIQKIEKDLKTIPYSNLTWNTIEGINLQPFYRKENLKDTLADSVLTGNSTDWEIRQDIRVINPDNDNCFALEALGRGATALRFIFGENFKPDKKEFRKLLENIFINCIGLHFYAGRHSSYLMKLFADEVRRLGIDPASINGTLNIDPIGTFSLSGNPSDIQPKEFKIAARLINQYGPAFPGMKVIGINADIFHNAGASVVQELGFSLAIMSDYLSKLTEQGIKTESVFKSMHLNFAVGPVYFMEIAKIRAARILFAQMVKAWGVESPLKAYIHCNTSEYVQTIYDPYVNMLRSTTQSMSAALGGADSITVIPFDNAFREPSSFSERIARNTNIILKEEAFFNRVSDPASGSYYIETLTSSLVKSAWDLLIRIENEGGYIKSFKTGFIQKITGETNATRSKNISTRKDTLVGINKYPDTLDRIPGKFDHERAFPPPPGEMEIVPLQKIRLAREIEELRIKNETAPDKKKVFLLTFGNITWRRARAGFSSDFFGCAGYEIVDNPGFDSPEQGVAEAKKYNADITVFCSSDAEYAAITSGMVSSLKEHSIVVLAGLPKDIEDLKGKGIENYIHLKSNLPGELKKFLSLIPAEK